LGRLAITYFLLRHDLASHASPIETFYPINYTQCSLFFATPDAVSPRLGENTTSVHSWNTHLKTLVEAKTVGNRPPPPNSWLGAMFKRYGVELDAS